MTKTQAQNLQKVLPKEPQAISSCEVESSLTHTAFSCTSFCHAHERCHSQFPQNVLYFPFFFSHFFLFFFFSFFFQLHSIFLFVFFFHISFYKLKSFSSQSFLFSIPPCDTLLNFIRTTYILFPLYYEPKKHQWPTHKIQC